MSKAATLEATPGESKRHLEKLDRYIAEMEEMKQAVDANRREIEKIKARKEPLFKAILARLKDA